MITKIEFQGVTGWKLENNLVSAVVLPTYGGKIASFVEKETNFELLFQNPKPTYERSSIYSVFSEFEACGFDDAFPGVNKETVQVGEKLVEYPDHGEIWSAQMECQVQGEELVLTYTSPLLGYHYKKTLSLVENRLVCDYAIDNPTNTPIPAIWTCHCLVRYEDGMEILLPPEAETVENVYETQWLGPKGKVWDKDALECITKFPPFGDLKYEMEQKVTSGTSGTCGYWYHKSQIKASFHYYYVKLPYLG